MSARDSRIPHAGQGAGLGLPNRILSSAVYVPAMSVVLWGETLESMASLLVWTQS